MPDIAIRTLHILVLLRLIKTMSPKIQYSSPYLRTPRLNSLLCLCNELVEHLHLYLEGLASGPIA